MLAKSHNLLGYLREFAHGLTLMLMRFTSLLMTLLTVSALWKLVVAMM